MRILSKLRNIKKNLLTFLLTANLVLVSTGSAQLDLSANTSTDSAQTTQSILLTDELMQNYPNIRWVQGSFASDKVNQTEGFFEDQLVVRFKPEATEDEKLALLSTFSNFEVFPLKHVKSKLIRIDPAQREAIKLSLEVSPIVSEVVPSYVVQTQEQTGGCYPGDPDCCIPDDPYQCDSDYQWGLRSINAYEAWINKGRSGSSSVTIAVIDSGVDYNHYDLGLRSQGGRIIKGADVTTFNFNPDPMDDSRLGHGTQVAGILGARTNNGVGIAGVDWYANIVAIKAFWPEFTGNNWVGRSNVLVTTEAFSEAVNPSSISGNPPPPPANVINFSSALLTNVDDPDLRDAVTSAIAQGVSVVAAVQSNGSGGNSSSCFMGFPAAYSGVISVASINSSNQGYGSCTGNVLNATTYGPLDVVAPGKDIFTTNYDSPDFLTVSGTSFATAFVSGAMSILKSCSNTPLTDLLQTADDLGASGWDSTYGYGRINLSRAVSRTCNDPASGNQACDGNMKALEILRYVSSLEGRDFCQMERDEFANQADVNGSGAVDVVDSLLVHQYAFGLRNLGTTGLIGPLIPPNVDYDGDLLTDQEEASYSCLNPQVADAFGDPDGDILSGAVNIPFNNMAEIVAGTNPCVADGDGDQFSDAVEFYLDTDPRDNCPNNSNHDAWPLDINKNGVANVQDIQLYKGKIPSVATTPELRRLDLNASGIVNTIDVNRFKGQIPQACY